MKKVIALILVLTIAICTCGASKPTVEAKNEKPTETFELSKMTYDELLDLYNRVAEALNQEKFIEQFETQMGDTSLYKDEILEISFSDLSVTKYSKNSYMKTELLLKNNSDEQVRITCESIIVNGCTIPISKYVEIPAKTVYLNEWTNDGELIQKYSIESIDTFEIIFHYDSDSKNDIRTQVVNLQGYTVQIEEG